jgi:hypothetical protein
MGQFFPLLLNSLTLEAGEVRGEMFGRIREKHKYFLSVETFFSPFSFINES